MDNVYISCSWRNAADAVSDVILFLTCMYLLFFPPIRCHNVLTSELSYLEVNPER